MFPHVDLRDGGDLGAVVVHKPNRVLGGLELLLAGIVGASDKIIGQQVLMMQFDDKINSSNS